MGYRLLWTSKVSTWICLTIVAKHNVFSYHKKNTQTMIMICVVQYLWINKIMDGLDVQWVIGVDIEQTKLSCAHSIEQSTDTRSIIHKMLYKITSYYKHIWSRHERAMCVSVMRLCGNWDSFVKWVASIQPITSIILLTGYHSIYLLIFMYYMLSSDTVSVGFC